MNPFTLKTGNTMATPWTAEDFDNAALQVCRALEQETTPTPSCGSDSLLLWSMETAFSPTTSKICLKHPPVMTLQDDASDQQDDVPKDGYVDRSLVEDLDSVDTTTGPTDELQWSFSIVYSETWQDPVIYFTVQRRDGSLCDRDFVVSILRTKSRQNQVEDSWEFVSYDEHPITGTPALFLHPCRTKERLQVLARCPQTAPERLWSWMSMVFPSLGFSVPAKTYERVRQRLTETDNT